MVRRQHHQPRRQQRGAAAIEFALLFTLFFAIFYALVSYAITMMLQQSFTHAAAEGARAAIAVNPLAYPDTTSFNTAVAARVRSTVDNALDWLPQKARAAVTGQNVGIGWNGNILTVQIKYTGYAANPMLPALNLPVIGDVPRLPADLAGSASITL